MDRRAFLVTVGGGLLTASRPTDAQPKAWRIGFLGVGTAARFEPQIGAMRHGLRDHGYVESKNITIEFRWAEGRYDRLPALAAELVRLNLDVIITHGGPGTLALRQATSTIPIVMAAIGNAVEVGAVASLARPGGNITGSSFLWEEVNAKRVDILKAAIPNLTRVASWSTRTALPTSSLACDPWSHWRERSTSRSSPWRCGTSMSWTPRSRWPRRKLTRWR